VKGLGNQKEEEEGERNELRREAINEFKLENLLYAAKLLKSMANSSYRKKGSVQRTRNGNVLTTLWHPDLFPPAPTPTELPVKANIIRQGMWHGLWLHLRCRKNKGKRAEEEGKKGRQPAV